MSERITFICFFNIILMIFIIRNNIYYLLIKTLYLNVNSYTCFFWKQHTVKWSSCWKICYRIFFKTINLENYFITHGLGLHQMFLGFLLLLKQQNKILCNLQYWQGSFKQNNIPDCMRTAAHVSRAAHRHLLLWFPFMAFKRRKTPC